MKFVLTILVLIFFALQVEAQENRVQNKTYGDDLHLNQLDSLGHVRLGVADSLNSKVKNEVKRKTDKLDSIKNTKLRGIDSVDQKIKTVSEKVLDGSKSYKDSVGSALGNLESALQEKVRS